MDYELSLEKTQTIIDQMNESRWRMHDGILMLRDQIGTLAEYWEGDDLIAAQIELQVSLNDMYNEEKRLNELAWNLQQYLDALKENIARTKRDIEAN